MPYLDNAATSWPKPDAVIAAIEELMREAGANPGRAGHSLSVTASQYVEEARMLLAQLFNAEDHRRIVFTLNCTDALNLALKGLLKPGDHVVADKVSHNSIVRPLNKLIGEGIEVSYVNPQAEAPSRLDPEELGRNLRHETVLLAVTHASNVHGIVRPVDEYGTFAQEHGLLLLVDAAQTAGVYPIDVRESKVDLLAFPGHKGLLGPMGTGGLYVGPRVCLDSVREGGTGTESELEQQPLELPYRFESGTLNAPGIAGLGAGIKHILEHGLERFRAHELALSRRLKTALQHVSGLQLYTAPEGCDAVGVVSFNLAGWDPGELGVTLDQVFDIQVRGGLHCAPTTHKVLGTFPGGTLRASVGCFNTEADIDALVGALTELAAQSVSR